MDFQILIKLCFKLKKEDLGCRINPNEGSMDISEEDIFFLHLLTLLLKFPRCQKNNVWDTKQSTDWTLTNQIKALLN